MGAFVNANREFVDLAPCDKIDLKDRFRHVPQHVLTGVVDDDDDAEEEMSQAFSTASFEDDA